MDNINDTNKNIAGRIKEKLAPANDTDTSSAVKYINKANKEYRNILEMWHYYLNFSRLEF
jgi:hypothetical protein